LVGRSPPACEYPNSPRETQHSREPPLAVAQNLAQPEGEGAD
jgi:hypothetical protein